MSDEAKKIIESIKVGILLPLNYGPTGMTKEKAARLLRTEHIGDSEQMELAKQMGAEALDRHKNIFFVVPRCEKCGRYVPSVEIEQGPRIISTAIAKGISPSHCPHCYTRFISAEIDTIEHTCILKGREE